MHYQVYVLPDLAPPVNGDGGGEPEELFAFLVRSALHGLSEEETEEAVRSIAQRESRRSTVLAEGIAFPHGRPAFLDPDVAILCACRFRRPVIWPLAGGREVMVAWLICSPPAAPGSHILLLEWAAGLSRTLLMFCEESTGERRVDENLTSEDFRGFVEEALGDRPDTTIMLPGA